MRIGFNIFGACPRQTSNKNNKKKNSLQISLQVLQ